ncbi:sugar transferase [Sphingomonas cavernae]|uniref:Sugar transferase n=1 Tax=Sphingomonas cavernae TaxID=2320861 RepID=A0A418W6W8_9SPHN|nr:sugar transferase [Sphingomonas cavernae]RJF85762.1 sugar transferase [Sphingomonas cavernae]
MNAPVGSVQGKPFVAAALLAPAPFTLTKRSRRLGIYASMVMFDAGAVLLGFLAANLLILDNPLASPGLKLAGLVLPVFSGIALNNRAYVLDALTDPVRGTMRAIMSLLAASALVLFMLYGLGLLREHHPAFIATAIGSGALLLVFARAIADTVSRRVLDDNPVSELMIVDGVPHVPSPGVITLHAEEAGIQPDMGDPIMLDRLGHLLRAVDKVTVACQPERRHDWTLALRGAAVAGEVRTDIDAMLRGNLRAAVNPDHIRPLSMVDLTLKRLLDLTIVIPALLFALPLLILVAIAIKFESSGPVLFVQQRLGHGNRLFRMYKFRSMRADRGDAAGTTSASRDDDRVTRVGRFIRATSIDELPQLFNVLIGNMSLVGPRPHALGSTASSKLFWDIDRNYWLRHACMPGLTGLAQVRGFRGATQHASDLENRLAADLEYVRDWSLWLDIAILFRTFGVVIHKNAF